MYLAVFPIIPGRGIVKELEGVKVCGGRLWALPTDLPQTPEMGEGDTGAAFVQELPVCQGAGAS